MRFSFERQRNRLAFSTAHAPRPDLLPDVGVEEVESAVVTRFARHRTERRGFWTTTGAVHRADGNLVPTSVRVGGVSGDQVRSDDPARIERTPATLLEGRWLYIGNWMRHFGHFLTETLTTLWLDDDAVDGVLAHPFVQRDRQPSTVELRLYHAAGWAQSPRLVEDDVRVERLVVPTRPFVPNAGATPEATVPWDRIAASIGRERTPARVFLSRSGFHRAHADRTGAGHPRAFDNDDEVDALMATHGFHVAHPERLEIEQQVRLALGADVLAGPSGTALHLAAFAGSETRVLELGDPRSPDGLPNQRAIAAVRGQPYAAFGFPTSARGSERRVDLRALSRSLRRLGL